MSETLDVQIERWPLREPFTIARGAKTEAVVVVVTLRDGEHFGRGEAVPYARYGETPEGVVAAIRNGTAQGGAAANALDLARVELEAHREGCPVWKMLGLPEPVSCPIFNTIPIRNPFETYQLVKQKTAGRPSIKLKLGAADDLARVVAARKAAREARIIVDVNEGWDLQTLNRLAPRLHELGVELIEQPLPADQDDALVDYRGPVELCADESFVGGAEQVERLVGRYQVVNVKLDKAGGLRPALEAVARADELGLEVMVGTMVATSLAIAPAVLLGQESWWADLDGALFLARDREPGLRYEGSSVLPPDPDLWGSPHLRKDR